MRVTLLSQSWLWLHCLIITVAVNSQVSPVTWFGGMFSVSESSPANIYTVNHLTGDKSCPANFASQNIGRLKRSSSSNDHSTLNICFRSSTVDATKNFGGAYVICVENTNSSLTNLTKTANSNIGTTAVCPSGYQPMELPNLAKTGVTGGWPESVCSLVFCYNFVNAWDHEFGGVYGGSAVNPITNLMSCPYGYFAYPFGPFKSSGSDSSNQYFYCSRPNAKFGGAYQPHIDRETGLNTHNAYTGDYNCPNDYEPIRWAQIKIYSTGYSDIWFCLKRNTPKDPTGQIGGGYQLSQMLGTDSDPYFGLIKFGEVTSYAYNGHPNRYYECPSNYLTTAFNVRCGQPNYRPCTIAICYSYIAGAEIGGFFSTIDDPCTDKSDVVVNPLTGRTSCPSGYETYYITEHAESNTGSCRMKIAYCAPPLDRPYRGFFAIQQPSTMINPNPFGLNSACDPGYTAYAVSSHIGSVPGNTNPIVVYACYRKPFRSVQSANNFKGAFSRCSGLAYYQATPDVGSNNACPSGTSITQAFKLRSGNPEILCELFLCYGYNAASNQDLGGFYLQSFLNGGGFSVNNPVTSKTSCPDNGNFPHLLTIGKSHDTLQSVAIYWCAPRQSWFGGFWSADSPGGLPNGLNSLNGDKSCPMNFEAHVIARLRKSTSVTTDVHVCLRSGFISDPTFNFGGAYSTCADQTAYYATPNIISSAKQCPSGYKALRIGGLAGPTATTSETTCELVICYNEANSHDHEFGGAGADPFYQANPLASDFTCPIGYSKFSLANVKKAGSNDMLQMFYCARPVQFHNGVWGGADDPDQDQLNGFTGTKGCADGFGSHKFARLDSGSGWAEIWLCRKSNFPQDPSRNFGDGFFLSSYTSQDAYAGDIIGPNVRLTTWNDGVNVIANRNYSCVEGFRETRIPVRCALPQRDCWLGFCWNWFPGAEIGGFYSVVPSNPELGTRNALTGDFSCPAGYVATVFYGWTTIHSCFPCRQIVMYCLLRYSPTPTYFNGFYVGSSDSTKNQLNSYTGNFSCAHGFASSILGRLDTATAGNEWSDLLVCLAPNYDQDPARNFGGGFVLSSYLDSDPLDSDNYIVGNNVLLTDWISGSTVVASRNRTCKAGYRETRIQVRCATPNRECWLGLCWNWATGSQIGGFFSEVPSNPALGTVNPITQGFSCPGGYEARPLHEWTTLHSCHPCRQRIMFCALIQSNRRLAGGIFSFRKSTLQIGQPNPLTGSSCDPDANGFTFAQHLDSNGNLITLNSCFRKPGYPETSPSNFLGGFQRCHGNYTATPSIGSAGQCPAGSTSQYFRVRGENNHLCELVLCYTYSSALTQQSTGGFYLQLPIAAATGDVPNPVSVISNVPQMTCPAGFHSFLINSPVQFDSGVTSALVQCSKASRDPWYRGWYTVGSATTNFVNHFTGSQACPENYAGQLVGKFRLSAANDNFVQIFVCLRRDLNGDPNLQFGGVFTKCADGTYWSTSNIAPLGASGTLSCPTAYQRNVRFNGLAKGDSPSESSCDMTICFNFNWAQENDFAGAMADFTVPNPLTLAQTCPLGFFRYNITEVKLVGSSNTILLGHCGKYAPWFGGFYSLSQNSANRRNTIKATSPWGVDVGCGAGFEPVAIGNVDNGLQFDEQSTLYVCVRYRMRGDPTKQFGGVFLVPDLPSTGSTSFGPAVIGTSYVSGSQTIQNRNFSCSSDYRLSSFRIRCGTPFVACTLGICWNNITNGEFGGFMSTVDNGETQSENRVNPLTNAISCPSGYVMAPVNEWTVPGNIACMPSCRQVITYCTPVPNRKFGGFFALKTGTNELLTANPYTNAASCEPGFMPQVTAQFYGPSNVPTTLFACRRQVYSYDAVSNIQAMFSRCSTYELGVVENCTPQYRIRLRGGADGLEQLCHWSICTSTSTPRDEHGGFYVTGSAYQVLNPLTNALNCPAFFVPYKLADFSPYDNPATTSTLWYCRKSGALYGGMYSIDEGQIVNGSVNHLTGAMDCQTGYSNQLVGRFHKTPTTFTQIFGCLRTGMQQDDTQMFGGVFTKCTDGSGWATSNLPPDVAACPAGYQGFTIANLSRPVLASEVGCDLTLCYFRNLVWNTEVAGFYAEPSLQPNALTNGFNCSLSFFRYGLASLKLRATNQIVNVFLCAKVNQWFGGMYQFGPGISQTNAYTGTWGCMADFASVHIGRFSTGDNVNPYTNLYVCLRSSLKSDPTKQLGGIFMLSTYVPSDTSDVDNWEVGLLVRRNRNRGCLTDYQTVTFWLMCADPLRICRLVFCVNFKVSPNFELSGGLFSVVQTGASSTADVTLNPITNSFGCPSGYQVAYATRWATGPSCLPCQQSLAYCAPLNSGRNFGGFFTTRFTPHAPFINNSYTGEATCEPGYYPHLISLHSAPSSTSHQLSLYACQRWPATMTPKNNFGGSWMVCDYGFSHLEASFVTLNFTSLNFGTLRACPASRIEVLLKAGNPEHRCSLNLCFSWNVSAEQDIGGFYVAGPSYNVDNPVMGSPSCPTNYTGKAITEVKPELFPDTISTLFMCQRFNAVPWFGGFFSIDENVVTQQSMNHLTGGTSCPPDYIGQMIGRFARTNSYEMTQLYVCTRSGFLTDPLNLFGGVFARCVNQTVFKTSNLLIPQCPVGYSSIKVPSLTLGPAANGRREVSCELTICYNFGNSFDSDFAGIYADQNWLRNSISETYGCPPGFHGYYLANLKIAFVQRSVNLYYCARFNPWFGGFIHSTDHNNAYGTPNVYTGDYSCSHGFAPRRFARFETGNGWSDVLVCLRTTLAADPTRQFGGAYQISDYDPSDSTDTDNYATGNIALSTWSDGTYLVPNRNYTCPSGFQSVGFRARCAIPTRGCSIVFCFSYGVGGEMGGFFGYTSTSAEMMLNPVTQGLTCPVGYQLAYVASHVRGISCHPCRKWILYCAALNEHRTFGGFFVMRHPGASPLMANSYTGTANCQPGFIAYAIGSLNDKDSPPNVILYVCLRANHRQASSPSSNFGGAFQTCNGALVLSTQNIGYKTTCPVDYPQSTVFNIRNGDPEQQCQLTICFHADNMWRQDFGGVFLTSAAASGVSVANPISGSETCPSSFSSAPLLSEIVPLGSNLTSDAFSCVRSTSFFGGLFSIDETADMNAAMATTPNHMTGSAQCGYGYTTQLIGRFQRGTGVNTLVFVCTLTGRIADPTKTFGGAFSICEDGSSWASNTIARDAPACPMGYDAITIANLTRGLGLSSSSDVGCEMTFCHRMAYSYDTEFGGAMAQNPLFDGTVNPTTQEFTCSPGYLRYTMGRFKVNGSQEASELSYCARPNFWFGGFYATADDSSLGRDTVNSYTGGLNCSAGFAPNLIGNVYSNDGIWLSFFVCLKHAVQADPTRQLGAIAFASDADGTGDNSDPERNLLGDGAFLLPNSRVYACKDGYQQMVLNLRCGNPIRRCNLTICHQPGHDLGGFFAYPEEGASEADLRLNAVTNATNCPDGYSVAYISEWTAGDACDPCRQWLAYCAPIHNNRTFGGFFSVEVPVESRQPGKMVGPNVYTGVAECQPGFNAVAFSRHTGLSSDHPNVVAYYCQRDAAFSLPDRTNGFLGAYQRCDGDPSTITVYSATPDIGTTAACPAGSSAVRFRLRGGNPERLCELTFCYRFDFMNNYETGGFFSQSILSVVEYQQNNPSTSSTSCPIGYFAYLLSYAKPLISDVPVKLHYCARPNPWFGGFFAVHDGQRLSQVNELALSGYGCQAGYSPQRVGRLAASQNGQDATGSSDVYVCTKATLKADPTFNFGGAAFTLLRDENMFQVNTASLDRSFYFATSNIASQSTEVGLYKCPPSYAVISWRLRGGPHASIFYICYNEVKGGEFAGAFGVSDQFTTAPANPLTLAKSCPPGYLSYSMFPFAQVELCSPYCLMQLYYCAPTNRRLFGGIFSVRPSPALVWPNAYDPSGAAACEPGFRPHIFSRHRDSTTSDFIYDFVCLRQGQTRDTANNFGGAFQKCPILVSGNVVQDDYRTPGISASFTCPQGFTAKSITYRVTAGVPERNCFVTFCLNRMVVPQPFGGFFSLAKHGSSSLGDQVSNTLTGDQSCPPGYETHAFGRSYGPNCQCEMRHFYCRLPTRQFGGFFTDEAINSVNPFTGAQKCPSGFSSRRFARLFSGNGWVNANVCLRIQDDPYDADPSGNFFGAYQRCDDIKEEFPIWGRFGSLTGVQDSYSSDGRIAGRTEGCPRGSLEMTFVFAGSMPIRRCRVTFCIGDVYHGEIGGLFTAVDAGSYSYQDQKNNPLVSSRSCPANYVPEKLLTAAVLECNNCPVNLFYCRPDFPPATKDLSLLELGQPLLPPLATSEPTGGVIGTTSTPTFFGGFFCRSPAQSLTDIYPNPYSGKDECPDTYSQEQFASFVDPSLRTVVHCFACIKGPANPPFIDENTNFIAAFQTCPQIGGQTHTGTYSTWANAACPSGSNSTTISVLNLADGSSALRTCTVTFCYLFNVAKLNGGVTYGGIFLKAYRTASFEGQTVNEISNSITEAMYCPEFFSAYLIAKVGAEDCQGLHCQLYLFYCRPDQSYYGGIFGVSTKMVPNTYTGDVTASCPKRFAAERFARIVRGYIKGRPIYVDLYVCLRTNFYEDPTRNFGGAFMTCQSEGIGNTYNNIQTSNIYNYTCPWGYTPIVLNVLGSKPPQPCKVTVCLGAGTHGGQLGGMFVQAENNSLVFEDQTFNPKTGDVTCPLEYTTHTILKISGLSCPNCFNTIKQCKLIGNASTPAEPGELFENPPCLHLNTTPIDLPVRMPNIDYLGSGYDIFFGNPQPSQSVAAVDPGYRGAVFNLTTNCEQLTADRRFTIPINVTVRQCLACSLDSQTTDHSSLEQYQSSLKAGVQFSGKFPSATFGASLDYKQVAKSMSEFNHYIYEQTVRCMVYCAMIEFYTPPPLTFDFRKAVLTLPVEFDYTPEYAKQQAAIEEFVDNYGTHIVAEVKMGSMYGKRTEICSDRVGYFQSKNVDIKAQLKKSFLISKVSASASVSYGSESSDTVSTSTSKTTIFSIGSRPPLNGTADEWLATSFENPIPIQVRLVPIYNILAPEYFPSDPLILQRRAILEEAIDDYCDRLVNLGFIQSCSGRNIRPTNRPFTDEPNQQAEDYFMFEQAMPFCHAENTCVFKQGELAMIDTSNFEAIKSFMLRRTNVDAVWVGVHRRGRNRNAWMYVDGRNFDIASNRALFLVGEPNSQEEMCLVLRELNGFYGLNDVPCNFEYRPLCKRLFRPGDQAAQSTINNMPLCTTSEPASQNSLDQVFDGIFDGSTNPSVEDIQKIFSDEKVLLGISDYLNSVNWRSPYFNKKK